MAADNADVFAADNADVLAADTSDVLGADLTPCSCSTTRVGSWGHFEGLTFIALAAPLMLLQQQ